MMSMIKEGGCIVQAFPVGPHTYIGTPNAFETKGYSIIHATGDGTITFNFGNQGTVAVTVSAGQDLAIHDDCISLDASVECWVS